MPICPVCVTYWDPTDGHADCPGRTVNLDEMAARYFAPSDSTVELFRRVMHAESTFMPPAPKIEAEWIGELPANAPDLCPKCGAYWSPCGCSPQTLADVERMLDSVMGPGRALTDSRPS